jgi:hypothetical protein
MFKKFSQDFPPLYTAIIVFREGGGYNAHDQNMNCGGADFMYLAVAPLSPSIEWQAKPRNVTLNWVQDGGISEPHFSGDGYWWSLPPALNSVPMVLLRERIDGKIVNTWTNNPTRCGDWLVVKNGDTWQAVAV